MVEEFSAKFSWDNDANQVQRARCRHSAWASDAAAAPRKMTLISELR